MEGRVGIKNKEKKNIFLKVKAIVFMNKKRKCVREEISSD